MKFKYSYLLLTLIITLFSCSSSSDGGDGGSMDDDPTENIVIELQGARDIFPTWAKFRGEITQDNNSNRLVGFVFSTEQNPIVNNANTETISDFRNGSSEFEFSSFTTLQPNTTYYIRAFVLIGVSDYNYSNELTFQTTGYFGPGGGYVGFDKGITTDDWRYMEIHPTTLNYSSAGVGGSWGDMDNFISGTYPDFGKGLENTTTIVNNTTAANCAAKLCANLDLNGYSDWFLPSIQELYQLSFELRRAGISIHYSAWSSTQEDSNFAYLTSNTLDDPMTIIINTNSKAHSEQILPFRRY